jgi:methyl-accepting chemotaxis protein
MTISAFITIFATLSNIQQANIDSTKKSLEMLNQSIFQSLRTAMNTGDPEQIQLAENHAKDIAGVKNLHVAKSKSLIELYSPGEQFTNDKDILKAFKTKETLTIEYDEEEHNLRMLRPMIASSECLACHVNQKENDVIGVIDLTFSLENSDDRLYAILTKVFVIITILGWGTLFIVFLVVKKSTEPIEVLEEAIKTLSEDDTNHNKININSSDEIKKVADYFNLYVEKIENRAKEDTKLIDEAQHIIEMAKKGNYSSTIKSNTSNKQLELFKKSTNEMISETNNHLQIINKALLEYSNYDYTKNIVVDGVDSQTVISELIQNINQVRDSITLTLVSNQTNGNTLQDSNSELTSNVNLLNVSTNQAAASLEETAAALEQITSNISSTTSDVVKMTSLANSVTEASEDGQGLAIQTTQAMDEINKEVTAISEAITIIDQIAFQTNILSLNAAVEAATAGDAGLGFAVVAGEVRTLASRSSEAASEIKKLVANATNKANNGKKIADSMIKGYGILNETIGQTINLIQNIETASKEQMKGIQQINDAVNSLDRQTQQNASIAAKTYEIAKKTDKISHLIVEDTNNKKFIGKEN